MKGDFSRIRFEPNKHYTDVLDQQGRIAYDADHNEQRFIDGHRRTVETIDVIGEYGAPMHDAGFAIEIGSSGLTIGAGRYYVHGLLCENATKLNYDDQPFLIDGGSSVHIGLVLEEMMRARSRACLRVFLEVWQRLVTALDDQCLGEPALGQADTTVRVQTVWRVVAEPALAHKSPSSFVDDAMETLVKSKKKSKSTKASLEAEVEDVIAAMKDGELAGGARGVKVLEPIIRQPADECSCAAMYKVLPPKHTGTLDAQVADNNGDCGCQPIPAAGYTGQENQLYRFEIQRPGTLATATLKWSRENASIVVAVLSVSGSKVTVNSLGMDANLGFEVGQWVEISDDADLFGKVPNRPGRLYQIQHIERPSMTLTMTTTVQPVDPARNARMRRWEQSGPTATADGVPLSENWIDIENGIQVRFGKGHYFAGDAWVIAARSATGQIDWPPCGSDGEPFQPPCYTHIYRAPLACIHFDEKGAYKSPNELYMEDPALARKQFGGFVVDDCRRLFPPLTDLGFVNAKALHVTHINWKNDDVVTFDALVRDGLAVTFDHAPTGPLSPANFIVTLETPTLLGAGVYKTDVLLAGGMAKDAAQMELADAASAYEYEAMPTVIRTPFILDSTVQRHGRVVTWTLPTKNQSPRQLLELEAIDRALAPWARRGMPVRARVKLAGRVLYARSEGGKQLYLDGQAFGKTVRSGNDSKFLSERIDLQLPSGNDERASDFESWFYLYPALGVRAVGFKYDEVLLARINGVPTIVETRPEAKTKPATQQAKIELTYVATEDTPIQLSMSGDSDIAGVPAEVVVKAGDVSVTVDVTFDRLPSNDKGMTFTLTATLPSALGHADSQSASFVLDSRGGSQLQGRRLASASAEQAPAKEPPAKKPRKTTRRKEG